MSTKPTDLLEHYQAIERTSQAMLDAAQAHDWDAVMRLESACAVLIERLRELGQEDGLTPTERARKQRIMLTLLRHDAQIRALVEPWVDDLWQHLAPNRSTLLH
ncbi:MAG: flagellar protein FliT [Pseudomonadota bacterium]